MIKILVVEDEVKISTLIKDYLEVFDYQVEPAYNGIEALKLFQEKKFDLILLDIMIPKIDGMDVLKEIRSKSSIPIIMLTAKSSEEDTLLALDRGADDYITKPFSFKILSARIQAVLRRNQINAVDSQNMVINHLDFSINSLKRECLFKGNVLDLTAAQFSILKKMISSPGQVFSRLDLLKSFQEEMWIGYERSIDVHIKNIRKIIEKDPKHPQYIKTVWGIGYKMEEFL